LAAPPTGVWLADAEHLNGAAVEGGAALARWTQPGRVHRSRARRYRRGAAALHSATNQIVDISF
jgi:hypothetical protein